MWNDANAMADGERPASARCSTDNLVPFPGPMPEARIGPNAILQLAHVMEKRIGCARSMKVMRKAGLGALPAGDCMIPEGDAVALHHALFSCEGDLAGDLVRESGTLTADYIIAHRIPAPFVWLLPRLPAWLGARMLMMAIGKHAWTFVGSGHFSADGPRAFSIDRSAPADWVEPPASLYVWYEAVFERLFQRLIAPDMQCCDTTCAGPVTRTHHYRLDRAPPR